MKILSISVLAGIKELLKKHQFWVAGGLLAGSVLELSFRSISARLLGTAEFGQLVYLTSLLLVLGSIASLGLGNVVPRYIPVLVNIGRTTVETFLNYTLRIAIISGISFSAALALFNLFIVHDDTTAIFLVSVFVPLYVLSELVYAVNRGYLRTRKAIFQREVVRRGIPLLLISVGYLSGIETGLILCLLAIGTGLICSILIGGQDIWKARADSSTQLPLTEIKRYAMPLVVSAALMQINARMDIFIANANLNSNELGIYGATIILPQLLAMLPGVFTFSLLPTLSHLFHQKDWQSMQQSFLRTTAILSLAGLGAAGFLWIGSVWWIKVFFGEHYVHDALLFDILIFANWLMACIGAFGVLMLASGLSKQYLLSDILALIIGGGGQWFLSFHYSTIGLSIGLLLTVVLLVIVRGLFVIRQLRLRNSKQISLFFLLIFFLLCLLLIIRFYIVELSLISGFAVWFLVILVLMMFMIRHIKSTGQHYGARNV